MSIITIASDFGTVDGYVAAMKGVIKSISPAAEIIDVTHDLQSVVKTSLVLWRYHSNYPEGTIHLVVVDPTVGSARKAIVGRVGKYYFVGPDNGVFTRVSPPGSDSDWLEIDSSVLTLGGISQTFHGRDIFAPTAAFISAGMTLKDIGKSKIEPVRIGTPEPLILDDGLEGEVIDIDKFGNLITNIVSEMVGQYAVISLNNIAITRASTFSEMPRGEPLAYVGSLGYLEIAVNLGRAVDYFSVSVGQKVRVIQ